MDMMTYLLLALASQGGGGSGGVTDVQVDGESVVTGGVAEVPLAGPDRPGVVLSGAVAVSGTTPAIEAQAGIRYVCGEVSTISFTPGQSGICDVIFTSGTSPAVLSVPPGVKWPGWFDPTSLDANTTYELNVMDGEYGAVMAWPS